MHGYQQRIVDEARELSDKAQKLIAFMDSEQFSSLPEEDQRRMDRQWQFMNGYLGVLRDRIEAFEKV